MRICNKKYFEFSLKLFGRGGSNCLRPTVGLVQKFQGEGVKSFQILKLFRGHESTMRICNKKHFKISLKLFGREGVKSSATTVGLVQKFQG